EGGGAAVDRHLLAGASAASRPASSSRRRIPTLIRKAAPRNPKRAAAGPTANCKPAQLLPQQSAPRHSRATIHRGPAWLFPPLIIEYTCVLQASTSLGFHSTLGLPTSSCLGS